MRRRGGIVSGNLAEDELEEQFLDFFESGLPEAS